MFLQSIYFFLFFFHTLRSVFGWGCLTIQNSLVQRWIWFRKSGGKFGKIYSETDIPGGSGTISSSAPNSFYWPSNSGIGPLALPNQAILPENHTPRRFPPEVSFLIFCLSLLKKRRSSLFISGFKGGFENPVWLGPKKGYLVQLSSSSQCTRICSQILLLTQIWMFHPESTDSSLSFLFYIARAITKFFLMCLWPILLNL